MWLKGKELLLSIWNKVFFYINNASTRLIYPYETFEFLFSSEALTIVMSLQLVDNIHGKLVIEFWFAMLEYIEVFS